MDKKLELLSKVIKEEASALVRCAEFIETSMVSQLYEIYERLLTTGGNLFTCGVGKSGLIARKIASTFSSLGQAAFFIHPTEALHGDIGNIQANDAIIMISKSGTTEEILKILPFLKIKRENIIALLGNVDSPIAQKSGLVFNCSVEKEACLNNLAPTTSSTVALALGDALAVAFEDFVGLSREKFALNHPGGLLGKSLSLKVLDLMVPKTETPVMDSDATLKEAILKMTDMPTGICCVLDDKENLLGIIVEGDIRRTLNKNEEGLKLKLSEVMNRNPITVGSDALAFEALKKMEKGEGYISVMPVLNGSKFLGIIRFHDLLKEGFSRK
ncbi:MAG: KpsF/GutQ family sugar-phosphate isomerase [Halobacteriovoraceae bacterium]|nr:KpsF/GutQ family sugar-phosphate isomerase [Halobacteriovoraceae bacterium]MCB9095642.1 KpsF/GutQ family sugar-phosphate isomerase [Halobacteriovoraceae bacterium]